MTYCNSRLNLLARLHRTLTRALPVFLSLAAIHGAQAQTNIWSGGTGGAWETPGNWTNGVPNNGSTFIISVGSALATSGTWTPAVGTLGGGSLGGGALSLSGSVTLNLSGEMQVGYSSGGTLTLAGSAQLTTPDVIVGDVGGSTGSVNLNGGTVTTGQISQGAGSGSASFGGGTLKLSGDQASLFSGFSGVTLNSGGGTIDTGTHTVTSAAPFTGTGGLTKQGSGQLTISGTNTYTGGTTVRNGTLVLASGTISQPASQLVVGAQNGDNATMTISGQVYASSAVVGATSGSTGVLNLNGGTLTAANVIEGSSTSHLAFNGGRFQATSDVTDLFSTFQPGSIWIGRGGALINTQGYTVTSNYAFNDNGDSTAPLIKEDTGTLILTGDLSLGRTTVETGLLEVRGPTTSNIDTIYVGYADPRDGNMTISDGAYVSSVFTYVGSITNSTTVGNAMTVTGVHDNGNGTFTSSTLNLDDFAIGSYGTATFSVEDGGQVIMGRVEQVFGTMTVKGVNTLAPGGIASSLIINNPGNEALDITEGGLNVEDGGQVTTVHSRIAVDQSYGRTASATVTGVSANGTASSWTLGQDLDVGYSSTGTLTIAMGGVVTAPIVMLGSVTGTDVHNHNAPYAGHGTLNLDSGGMLATGQILKGAGTGTINFDGGGVRATADTTDLITGFGTADVTMGANGAIFDTNGHAVTLNNALTGGGGLTKEGAGTLILTKTFTTSSGTTVITGGTLQLGNGGGVQYALGNMTNSGTLAVDSANTTTISNYSGSGSISVLAGTLAVANGTISGAIDGGGQFKKTGSGTLTLSGTNTFDGDLTVTGGTLRVASDANLGAATSTTNLQAGTLQFTGNATTAHTFVMGSGQISAGSGISVTYAGASVSGGFLSGSGTHILGNASSFQGVTSLASSHLAQTSGSASYTQGTVRGSLAQSAGATLDLQDSVVTSSGGVTTNGLMKADNVENDGTWTINNGGEVRLTTGDLTLGGGSRTTVNAGGQLNAQTGTSIELNGGLLVNNGTQTGVVDVNYGSTLKGSGFFGTVNVTDGGKFSPGNSPGTANVVNTTFGPGGSYQFELNSTILDPGVHQDLLNISNLLDITAGTTGSSRFTLELVTLNGSNNPALLSDFNSSQSYEFLLADAGTISGFDASRFVIDTSGFLNPLNGGQFSIVQSGNSLMLDYTAVPEPTAAELLLLGLALLALVAWRKREATDRDV